MIMKKLHLVLVMAFSMIIGSAYAQKVAVGGATGIGLLIRSGGANVTIPFSATAEYAFKENMSVAADIGYEIGPGGFRNFGIFYFSPEFRYHLSSAFKGAYVGGFFGVGSAQFAGNYLALGATAGYQIMIKDNFNIDIHGQAGWGSLGAGVRRFGVGRGAGRAHGFHLRPTVGLRYAF